MAEVSLYPVIEVPDFEEVEEEYDKEYRPSLKWDMEKGDFIRDGSNRIVPCDGVEAFRVWCLKAVQTERFRCHAYDEDMGAEMEDALREETSEAVESAAERTITEALMVNPRTESVEDFEFSWNGDELMIQFCVYGISGEELSLSTVY